MTQTLKRRNKMELVYLYLISPLHTGGTSQEGNLLGIARESHTDLPYVPSSTIRGRLRASESDDWKRLELFGVEMDDLKGDDKKDNSDGDKQNRKEALHLRYRGKHGKDLTQLEQGSIWIGDGSILWLPVPSLSHGVVWVSCPMLLRRWLRLSGGNSSNAPNPYDTNLGTNASVYLKDAILPAASLTNREDLKQFMTNHPEASGMENVLVLEDQHCATLIQMSLWRQVKIKLDEHKTVDGGFRYEEAIPPDTLMYFSWGVTSQANGNSESAASSFQTQLDEHQILQIGGQESLGRGFVQLFN